MSQTDFTSRARLLLMAAGTLHAAAASAQTPSAPASKRVTPAQAGALVRRVLRAHPIVDGHDDLYRYYLNCRECPRDLASYPLNVETKGTTDIPKWRRGGVGGQLYNVYGKDRNVTSLLEAFDLMHRFASTYPKDIRIAASSDELRAAMQAGRIGIVPMLEGAVLLQNNVALLRMYHRLGLRAVTFAYQTNDLADGSDDAPRHRGISALGRQMVAEMNRVGVMVDISHVSADAMRGVLEASSAPVIFTHSNAYGLVRVNRNVPDDVLRRLKQNGGIVMINFVPQFVSQRHADWLVAIEAAWKERIAATKDTASADKWVDGEWKVAHPEPVVTVGEVADHFDYVKRLIGVDHIGIGADFGNDMEWLVRGLADASTYPALLTELAMRGWTEAELGKITSGNFLRVFAAVESRAAALQRANAPVPPSVRP